MTIRVQFPRDRTKPGSLELVSEDGEVLFECPCLGKADNAAAARVGNPTRDPVNRNGDTPLGRYKAVWESPPRNPTAAYLRSYGPYGFIRLIPLSGQAAKAALEGKRKGLGLHGGALNARGELRPTHGCIRVTDGDMVRIVGLVRGKDVFLEAEELV